MKGDPVPVSHHHLKDWFKAHQLDVNTGSKILMENYKRHGTPPFPHVVNTLLRVNDVDKHLDHSTVENQNVVGLGLKGLKIASSIFNRPKKSN